MRPVIVYPRPEVLKQTTLIPVEKKPYVFPPLRPMQIEAQTAFLRLEKKHASLILPVGAGKTMLTLKLWDDLGQPNMLIVVPRIVLIQNPWLQELKAIGVDTDTVGQYYSEEKTVRHPITITIYNSLAQNLSLLTQEGFQMVIFDEADILQAQSYLPVLEEADKLPIVIGLTGTIREAARRNPRITQIMPIVFERTIAEARQENILAPAEIRPIYVDLLPEEKADYLRFTENYTKAMQQANNFRLPPFDRNNWLKRAFMINTQRLILLSKAHNKFQIVIDLAKQDKYAPTLVFSSSVDNIEALKAALVNNGILAETITAEMHDRKERQRIIENFGVTYNMLLSVGTLERGFNVPESNREIIVGGGTTLRQTEQRLGRVLRRDPENPFKIALIYVLVANGTIDQELLKRVNEAYNRIRIEGRID
jgi:DNA excision repair protein ERCC-3